MRSGAGDGGADCENASWSLAASRSSSGSDAAPLSFLTMHPTRPRGEPSDSEVTSPEARGVTGPTASISRQRWMSEDARGPDGGSSGPAVAVEEASDGAGEGAWKTAARAATGRVAEASAVSSASLSRRRASAGGGGSEAVAAAAAAAQRSNIIRLRLGVGSAGAAGAAASEKDGRCGGMRTLTLKKRLCLEEEGSLHGAESWGMAAREEAMGRRVGAS